MRITTRQFPYGALWLLAGCLLVIGGCASDPGSSETVDLRGHWIGEYPCCGRETVEITQRGSRVQATKVSGDDFVPAGEVTWRANVGSGDGEGQLADDGFANARFVTGHLTILDHDTIQFDWGNGALTVIYSRLD